MVFADYYIKKLLKYNGLLENSLLKREPPNN